MSNSPKSIQLLVHAALSSLARACSLSGCAACVRSQKRHWLHSETDRRFGLIYNRIRNVHRFRIMLACRLCPHVIIPSFKPPSPKSPTHSTPPSLQTHSSVRTRPFVQIHSAIQTHPPIQVHSPFIHAFTHARRCDPEIHTAQCRNNFSPPVRPRGRSAPAMQRKSGPGVQHIYCSICIGTVISLYI